jgi:hypothetical protein
MAATGDSHTVDTFDFNQEDLVTLLVGPEQKKMVVHGTYLARTSDFFKAALKKEWTEGQTRTINLPEECPEIMAHYLSYTYTKRLSSRDQIYHGKSDFDYIYTLLATLYVCGERFINPVIQQAVIKEIFRLMQKRDLRGVTWYPIQEEVNIIYRGTPEIYISPTATRIGFAKNLSQHSSSTSPKLFTIGVLRVRSPWSLETIFEDRSLW